jgi:hypothetical protein
MFNFARLRKEERIFFVQAGRYRRNEKSRSAGLNRRKT